MRRYILIILICITAGSRAQFNFGSPIDSSIKLAANFGELRENHFHSGLDIRTGGKEGWNVYAVEDGYIARILMSRKGYGNALYIAHPNGLTSVYGHLSMFNDTIKKFATTCQYTSEDFELDTLIPENILPVKRGEIIAYSGNTGGSTGPHLHFEIRDTKTEWVLNPENFGFQVEDRITPKIYSVSLFSLNGFASEFLQTISSIQGKTIIVEPGKIGIGVSGKDYYTDYEFNAGIYDIQLTVNDSLAFEKRMDTFSFTNWRCINAHIDYGILKSKGYFIEKCFRDDGDKTEIYYKLSENGIISIAPLETKTIKIIARDHAGNSSNVNFILKGGYSRKYSEKKYNALPMSTTSLYAKRGYLNIPPGALYDTCQFSFYADTSYRKYSYKYVVGNTLLPLQKEIELNISLLNTPKKWNDKLYIKSLQGGSIGGYYKAGSITAKTKTCGTYTVDMDTIPPVIIPLNIPASKNITWNSELKFRIYDSQTGVKNFKAKANGKFILFSYDLKYNLITCNLKDIETEQNIDFDLMVEDYCGNIKHYKTKMIRK